MKPRSRDVVDAAASASSPVGQPRPPRAEVHLVDAHRPGVRGRVAARVLHPRRRRPTRYVRLGHDATRWPAAPRCARAIGSAFSRHCAVGAEDLELVARRPRRRPGTNSSQTPEPPSERIGCARPSQWLKSPDAGRPRALGAQTANDGAGDVAHGAGRSRGRARRAPSTAARGGPRRSGAGRPRRASAGSGRGRPGGARRRRRRRPRGGSRATSGVRRAARPRCPRARGCRSAVDPSGSSATDAAGQRPEGADRDAAVVRVRAQQRRAGCRARRAGGGRARVRAIGAGVRVRSRVIGCSLRCR